MAWVINCGHCGKDIETNRRSKKYCCLSCAFWSRVDRLEGDKCWLWTGSKTKSGYGQFTFNGERYKSHRVSLVLDGRDPGYLLAMHSCDNPSCVNPSHLMAGTSLENLCDSISKKRWNPPRRRGLEASRCKLSLEDIANILEKIKTETHQKVADEYGVCRKTILLISTGKHWSKHVDRSE